MQVLGTAGKVVLGVGMAVILWAAFLYAHPAENFVGESCGGPAHLGAYSSRARCGAGLHIPYCSRMGCALATGVAAGMVNSADTQAAAVPISGALTSEGR